MSNIFVTSIEKEVVEQLQKDLAEQGFTFSKPAHTLFQAKKPGVTCTLYTSLKLTVQGKGMREFLEFYLEPEILKSPEYTYRKELALESLDKRARIGVDEAGKGDYFGPLCVAGVIAHAETLSTLLEIGVCDSKKLSDSQIKKMAPKIVKAVPNYIIRLYPQKYNQLYASFRNLNSLLAWCHATVIENLSSHSQTPLAIVDKFAHESLVERALRKKGVSIDLEQRTKAESDPVVAAASIVARWAFIEGMEILSKEVGFTLPKGAAPKVSQAAKRLVKEQGREALNKTAKLHFSITNTIC